MALIDEINEKRREIRTDQYPMSVSEWVSLYTDKEIDIHPEFQRFYRWSDVQKTNLIESILLGIPIPPVFVSQRTDGVWDVVDGLQRLSTIYQFMGILKDEDDNKKEPLILSGTKYLPGLEGMKWPAPDDPDDSSGTLSQDLRLIIKRSKINASIILKESDENTKYDLFQRLNTGGSHLSSQEVRNCILVMLDKTFYAWLRNLSKFKPFQETISLSERPLKEAYDLELALRFIIFSLIDEAELDGLGDVGEFITDKMRKIATDTDFDRDYWQDLFDNTFQILNNSLNDNAFRRYNIQKEKFSGGFLLSQFEVVACGIAWNIVHDNRTTDIEGKVAGIWSNTRYTEWSGSGVTATRRLKRILPFGREVFSA